MKQKSTTYLLLIVAAVIWGIIIVRIIKTRKGNDLSGNENRSELVMPATLSDSVYTLQLNYADPFLKGLKTNAPAPVSAPVSRVVAEPPKEKKIAPAPVPVVWPKIAYNGVIVNASGRMGHFMLNGKIYYVREQQEVAGIYVLRLTRDSVQTEYKKQVKWIKRK